jgi:hypothetical protein
MKIWVISYAGYSEDGELFSGTTAHKTLESAQAKLKEEYQNLRESFSEHSIEDDQEIDDFVWINADGTKCGDHSANQSLYEINEIELAD